MANNILLESGSTTLLESSSALQLESGTATSASFIDSPSRRRVTSKFLQQFRRRAVQATVPAGAHAHAPSGPSSGRCRRQAPIARRGRHTDVVPPQFNPPIVLTVPQHRIVRGWLRRRRPVEVVPAQQTVANPAFVPSRVQRRPARGFLRRGRHFEPYLYGYGLPVTDTFAGPVGAIHIADVTGQHWEPIQGTFKKDGAGRVQSFDANASAFFETYASDLWADLTFAALQPAGSGAAGLVLRYVDGNNYFLVQIDANAAYQIVVQRVLAGVTSTIFSGGAASAGDKISVYLAGPNFTIEQNGVLVTSFADASLQTATKFGIFSFDPSNLGRWLFDAFHLFLAPFVLPGQSSRRPINSRTFALARRGRHTDFISTPVAPVNPAIVFPAVQHRIVRGLLRRRRPVEVVPPQFNPPIVLAQPQRRVARAWPRRGKTPTVVPAAAAPPSPAIVLSRTQRRVQRGWLRARGRGAQPVPVQAVQINPALPGNTTLRRRLLALFSRRRTSGGRVPGSAISFGPTPNNVTGPDGRSFVTGATGRSSVSGPDGRSDVTGPSGSTIIQ